MAERLMHFAVDEDDDGSSPFGPATLKFQISNLKSQKGRLAETDQRRSEEPKSLARYQGRPPPLNKETTHMFALKSRFTLAT